MAKDVTGQDDDCKPNWGEISVATGFSTWLKVILGAKLKIMTKPQQAEY